MTDQSISSQLEDRRVDLDHQFKVAELEEKKAARLSEERHKRNELKLEFAKLRIDRGNKLPLTVPQATVAAALLALLGGLCGSVVQYFTTRDVEAGKSQTSLDVERTRNQGILDLERAKFETDLIKTALSVPREQDRIKNLEFFLKAGFIKDPQGKIAALKPADYPSFLPDRWSIVSRLEALSPAQVLSVEKLMEPVLMTRSAELRNLLSAIDPDRRRLTDADSARTLLMQWAGNEDPTDSAMSEWDRALTRVEEQGKH
jgi:hypothetical protein